MTSIRWRAAAAAVMASGLCAVGAGSARAATGSELASATAVNAGNAQVVAEKANVVQRRGVRVYSLCGARAAARGLFCYAPQTLQTAYGVSPLLAGGITGRGETIVLPEEAFPHAIIHHLRPHSGYYLRESVHAFDLIFKLPGLRLTIDTALADGSPADRVLSPEEILDVEMAHAMAPAARIVVDPISGNLTQRLPAVTRLAARQGKLVSFSYGTGERCVRHQLPAIQRQLNRAAAHGVSVFASSGDELDLSRTCTTGATNGVRSLTMPASDPLVTAVGGTQLAVDPANGSWAGETVWNQQAASGGHGGANGTGGGFSALFPTPAYQVGVPGITTQRGVPDVAFSASQKYGAEIVQYLEGTLCAKLNRLTGGHGSARDCVIVQGVGGTSVGSPAWAGIGALADQYAHHPLGLLNPAIYRIGESPSYASAFHDITTGDNSAVFRGVGIPGFSAGPGWDPTTGWGTPNASALVPLLAAGG